MKAILKAGTYPDFYDKEIKPHLAGAYHPHGKKFYNVGQRCYIWLVGGDNMIFTKEGPDFEPDHSDFGFSGRLLKYAA
ncbi:TPA: hypothetical protein DCZ39_07685 [Patescibacteria group bacterium]|nr:hypothetical protein [Candidatus Gracilibacteria bacterium]